jgi:hypothetical protein
MPAKPYWIVGATMIAFQNTIGKSLRKKQKSQESSPGSWVPEQAEQGHSSEGGA